MDAILLKNRFRQVDYAVDLDAGQRGEIRRCIYHKAYCKCAVRCQKELFYPYLYSQTDISLMDGICISKDEIRIIGI